MRLELALVGRVYTKKNSRRLIVRGGRRFFVPSINYERFLVDAINQIQKQCPDRNEYAEPLFKGEFKVTTTFYIVGNTRVDGDNLHTSILDVLQDRRLQIINDDSGVIIGKYIKVKQSDQWGAKIVIETIEEDHVGDN